MDTPYKSVVPMAAAVIAIAFGIYMLRKKNKKSQYSQIQLKDVEIPTTWQKAGEVQKINIYPLKSGSQMTVDKAVCTEKGLQEVDSGDKLPLQDRSFVLCDTSSNNMITIRNNTKLLHVTTEATDKQTVKFSHPSATTSFKLKIPQDTDADNFVSMWYDEKVKVADCGDEAAKWFSQLLSGKDNKMRLGYYNNKIPERAIGAGWIPFTKVHKKLRSEYMGKYSDVASYMLLGQSSVDDLNSRLKTPVTEQNFRPNLVVKGSKPYAEDSWDWVKIGDAVFRSFKCTARCTVITVDPITGIRDPNMEPLHTLKSYRQTKDKLEKNAPIMGLYLGLHETGVIKVGDPVYIVEK